MTIAYDLYIVFITELYPSHIKAIGVQLNSIANTNSYVIIPFVQTLFEEINSSIVISFCGVSLLICWLVLPLDETIGQTPPELI